ncbi:MAG TPA: ATP-binding protein [Actinomycetota bacterium]|nr:ATP-binding protein [Actinomycetota bacterium]
MARLFDLNIEEVLENWEVAHAIREVISNALDEQSLSGSKDIEIAKMDGDWVVRDFGRGLKIDHFTLNENKEKLAASTGVIGKFGVGLKDALATFHRRGVEPIVTSRYGTFRLRQTEKHGFDAITTLHVDYDDTPLEMEGTEFRLVGATDEQIDEAKSLFLRFNDEEAVDETRYGEILRAKPHEGRVYISGVFAAEEENFLFSYNVTHLTDAMKKRLNRERLNVGRTTYAERVKGILKESSAEEVHDLLIEELMDRGRGPVADELQWIEIAQMTLTLLHEKEDVLFVVEHELHSHPDVLDHARADGLKIVIVTNAEKAKLVEQARSGGVEVRTLENYVAEFNESFEYTFVDPVDLHDDEKEIYALTAEIMALVGIEGDGAPEIKISETMRIGRDDTEGVWDPDLDAIVVKRANLASRRRYAATLLHELAHATTGAHDVTREFENVLTSYLGHTSTAALDRPSSV